MARSKGVRRLSRGKGFVQRNEHFWTTMLEDPAAGTIGVNVLRFSPIVGPSDWVVRAGFTTATMVRIRGHISVISNGNAGAAGGQNVAFAIIVADADDASTFNPMTLISYQEHRVLWTRTWQSFQWGAVGVVNGHEENFEVDVKVRAKLKPDDYVYLVTFNMPTPLGTDDTLRLHCIMRALIVVK